MIHSHSSTLSQRVQWVSELLAQEGRYGVVSQMSRSHDVSRQSLYGWKAKGQAGLETALAPKQEPSESEQQLERAVLILLVEGHASYRGIQTCLASLMGMRVSLGTIVGIVQEAGERAMHWMEQHRPETGRALALDELYSSQRGEAYLNVVDVHSGAVWESTSPVAVDGESWTLLMWLMREQGLRWETLVSDGGRAIQEAVQAEASGQPIQRDVWHVLHECQKVQGRLDRLVERLQKQAITVARQAERLAQGKRALGAHPKSEVQAHTAQLQRARYTASALGYLSGELQRLLSVVVVAARPQQGLLSASERRSELDTLLVLLEELRDDAPEALQRDLKALAHQLQLALPHLLTFTDALEPVQQAAMQDLGAAAVHLLGWAWLRRAILGPDIERLAADVPSEWQAWAKRVFRAWEQAVRASSVVENWHSILRPFLAVHRSLSSGLLAILALWHNHRIAPRGLHKGQSPLQRSGMIQVANDWLLALGYPPAAGTAQNINPVALEHKEALVA